MTRKEKPKGFKLNEIIPQALFINSLLIVYQVWRERYVGHGEN